APPRGHWRRHSPRVPVVPAEGCLQLAAWARTARRGSSADTPLSQLSNSIGEVATVSMSRGRSIGLDADDASPGKHVVAALTPRRPRRSGNDGCVTPLG